MKLNFTLFPLVASAHHSIHRCWRGGSKDSSAPQWVELPSGTGPKIVPVPQLSRDGVLQCVPNMHSEEDPIAVGGPQAAWGHVKATDTVREAPGHSGNKRSSYRRVRRTSALRPPAEAHCEVLNGPALHEAVTDVTMNQKLQATRAQVLHVQDAQELASPPSAHVNRKAPTEKPPWPSPAYLGWLDGDQVFGSQDAAAELIQRVTKAWLARKGATTISLPSGSSSVFHRRGRKSKSEWQAYGAPHDEGTYPAMSVGTEVGAVRPQELGTQPSTLTTVGRQALWWGAEVGGPCPPKTLCLPATSCPVTTMACSWK